MGVWIAYEAVLVCILLTKEAPISLMAVMGMNNFLLLSKRYNVPKTMREVSISKKPQLPSLLYYLFPVTFRHSIRLHSNEALQNFPYTFWMQDSHISEKLKRDQINEHIESYSSLHHSESILGMDGMSMKMIHFSFTTYHLILTPLQYVT